MLRKLPLRNDTTDVHNAFNVVFVAGAREVVGDQNVQVFKICLRHAVVRQHRVNKVNGAVATHERFIDLLQRKDIALPRLEIGLWIAIGDGARQYTHLVAAAQKFNSKRLAGKAAAAGDGNRQGAVVFSGYALTFG